MKYRFIYHRWWKYLTLVILLYVFSYGFLRPLRPGVMSVSEFQLVAGGQYNIDVLTYNTFLTEGDRQISAYLKLDSVRFAQVPYVMVADRRNINIRGIAPMLPQDQKSARVTLLIHDSVDGYLILPSAFTLSNNEENIGTQSDLGWNDSLGVYDQEWTFRFPFIAILYETIRNTFFHVAIWMAMFILLVVALIYSLRYLRSSDLIHDAIAASFTHVAVLLGILGIITGSLWAKATWGTYWTDDPKLNMSAVAMMIYVAYSILRTSLSDTDKRAKISAAYNIFAFVAMIPLIFVIPRMADTMSLHPGNGGNPALGGEDLDNTLRLVFYPAVIGYALLGIWMASILFRIRRLEILNINARLRNT